MPLAASTAWQALFVHGRLRAGQRVLVHGAAGGVGVFAVQLARSAGATVIGTCRAPGGAARRAGCLAGGRPRPGELRGRRPGGPGPRPRRGRRSRSAPGRWSGRAAPSSPWSAASRAGAPAPTRGGCSSWSSRTAGSSPSSPAASTPASCARCSAASSRCTADAQAFEAKQARRGARQGRAAGRRRRLTRAGSAGEVDLAQLPARGDPQLGVDAAQVGVDGARAEVELPRDLLVGGAGDDQRRRSAAPAVSAAAGRRRADVPSRRWPAARRGPARPTAGRRAGRSPRPRRAGAGAPRPGAAPAGGARRAAAASGARSRDGPNRDSAASALLVVLGRDVALGEQRRGTGAAGRRPRADCDDVAQASKAAKAASARLRLADPDGRLDQVRRAAEQHAGVAARRPSAPAVRGPAPGARGRGRAGPARSVAHESGKLSPCRTASRRTASARSRVVCSSPRTADTGREQGRCMATAGGCSVSRASCSPSEA